MSSCTWGTAQRGISPGLNRAINEVAAQLWCRKENDSNYFFRNGEPSLCIKMMHTVFLY
jgi:hypothetical protein